MGQSTAEISSTARSATIAYLSSVPLLAGVPTDSIAQLAAYAQLKSFEKGQHVLHKGSVGDQLLFLLSGRLQAVDLTEDGREIGLNFLTKGDYFGELSIIDGQPRSASVVACENSLVAFLSRAQALTLIYHTPLVVERLLKKMAANIRRAANYRTIIGIPGANQRVFALLNQFAKVAPGGLVVIEKMPTQQEIAITVNTSRETVSRAIHLLIQRGVVEKDLRRLIVRRPEELKKAMTQEDEGVR